MNKVKSIRLKVSRRWFGDNFKFFIEALGFVWQIVKIHSYDSLCNILYAATSVTSILTQFTNKCVDMLFE